MTEYIGYGLAALSIIVSIVTTAIRGSAEARRMREKSISELASEKATLKSECAQMKGVAEEIKGYVKENFHVLSSQLATLESTMLASDELLGERIGRIEVVVAGHTEAIKNLKDDVREIKNTSGRKAG